MLTSPDNIWTPDSGDDYALTTDLAAMADTIQTALDGKENTAEFAHFGYLKTGSFNWTTTSTDHTWDSAAVEGELEGFSTANRITFTCTDAGVYQVQGQVTANTSATSLNIFLNVNGATYRTFNGQASASSFVSLPFFTTRRFAVGDTFKIQIQSGALVAGVAGTQSFIDVDMLHA